MKLNIIDILILLVPLIIMILITPVLPVKVPVHWNIRGVADGFIDKRYSFVLGLIPFALYELLKLKYGSK